MSMSCEDGVGFWRRYLTHMKKNLRALIESIVIEALEEWMDECECDELDEADAMAGVRAYGNAEVEKKSKKQKKA